MPPWSPSGSSVLRGEPLARGLILLTHALGSDGCLRILLLEASMVHRERTKSYILKMGFPKPSQPPAFSVRTHSVEQDGRSLINTESCSLLPATKAVARPTGRRGRGARKRERDGQWEWGLPDSWPAVLGIVFPERTPCFQADPGSRHLCGPGKGSELLFPVVKPGEQ